MKISISDLVVQQMLATRAACEATILGIDMFLTLLGKNQEQLAAVESRSSASPPEEASKPNEEAVDSPECPHTHKQHAPVMGNQGRFICLDCQAELEL